MPAKPLIPKIVEIPEGIIPPPGAIPFTQISSGIWVPKNAIVNSQQDGLEFDFGEPPIIMRYTRVTAGARDVVGRKMPIEVAIELLARFSIREIVHLISGITCILHSTPDKLGSIPPDLPQGEIFRSQFRITERLLGETQARGMFNKIRETHGNEYDPERIIIFQERCLLNALKLALLTVDHDKAGRNEPSASFVSALLIITDHLDPELGEMDTTTEEGRSAMELYISANALFNESAHMLHDFVRTNYIYIKSHDLKFPNSIDIPAMLSRATGLEPAVSWQVLFVLYVFWGTKNLEEVDAGKIIAHKSTYLQSAPALSQVEREHWFNLATWNIEELQERIKNSYSISRPNFFDILPFEEKPLIAFDDDVFCPSISMLRRMPGNSLQYRLLNKSTFPDTKDRENFLRTRGHVVEKYTSELLEYAFGDRFIPESTLQQHAANKSVCDGIIIYPNAIILMECKTFSVLLSTRHAQGYDAYRKKWKEAMLKASSQIESTIKLIKEGYFIKIGIDPTQIHEFYPVISVFDQPLHPLLYRAIMQIDLADHPLIERIKRNEAAPLQLLRILEVELWAIAAEKGRSILELLRKKVESPESMELPFHQFLDNSGEDFYYNHCQWHVEHWNKILQDIKKYFLYLGMKD